jgi:hypothetical protein
MRPDHRIPDASTRRLPGGREARRKGDPDAVESLEVEFFDKLPALALLLAFCVAGDARLADLAERIALDAPPRIEIPAFPPRKAASVRPPARPRCA